MTQRKLERLCRLWQKRLRLQDWKIKTLVLIAPDEELSLDVEDETDLHGRTTHAPSEMEVDQMCVRNDQFAERTLVHELLHLRLAPFSGILREHPWKLNREDKAAQEQAINLLADSFLQAYGESTGK